MNYQIKDASKILRISIYTLLYCKKLGLLAHVNRDDIKSKIKEYVDMISQTLDLVEEPLKSKYHHLVIMPDE